MKIRNIFILSIFWILSQDSFGQLQSVNQIWIDSLLSKMTLSEKIGQLFMVRAYGNNDTAHINSIYRLIVDKNIGGLCFFQGNAQTQADLTRQYQSVSKIPLLVSIDAEWGLGMRLKQDGFYFPKQLTLGAIQDNKLIYQMGKQMAAQLKLLGIHLNFAPVLDINNNPNNPVINERSFGSDKILVTNKSYAYMQGLQDGGILACAKHFPGHGDTDMDSHEALPTLNHEKNQLDTLELFPFRVMCSKDIASVMVGHLAIPKLEEQQIVPATLSHNIIKNILREEFQFKGLVITDALEMKAVSKSFQPGELEIEALKAGNDILLLSENIEEAILKIKAVIENGNYSIDKLNQSVRLILEAKSKAGLSNYQPSDSIDLLKKINHPNAQALKENIYRQAITLVKDTFLNVPIRDLNKKIVSLSVGVNGITKFQSRISDFCEAQHFFINKNDTISTKILDTIDSADLVIISLHKLSYKQKDSFGLNQNIKNIILNLAKYKRVILVVFGNPYIIKEFNQVPSILLAYEDNFVAQDISAQLLFGTDPIKGSLPLDISPDYYLGKSIKRPSLFRMGYAIPEATGLSSDSLLAIDKLAQKLVDLKVAPGCQILVAKDNKILYQKSFGTLDLNPNNLVQDETLYDLASLTKILASAPALMMMDDDNLLDVKKKLSHYLPFLKGSNKEDISIRDILLHQAKLLTWIPFYKSTLVGLDTFNLIDHRYYRYQCSDSFPICVAEDLFLRADFLDSVRTRIINSKLNEQKKFLYSDLGFYLIPPLVEALTGKNLVDYLQGNFYKPLGLNFLNYNPRESNELILQIAPSEEDTYFRHQTLRGHVHDMGAALLGGVSGHAGLFGNSKDVAIIMQCFLNNGNYGGREYFTAEQISSFTGRDEELGRRGLCFDLRDTSNVEVPYVSSLSSPRTFGHQGFTGTCTWADPDQNLLYVFLSNRTFPNGKINLLHRNRYRLKIHDAIYNAIKPRT
ncbi:MAG: serine hydrolase [Saprospiraceae bacterium]|nr:serine hydrolase [Candidatus Vicinibacter proximus]MBL7824735.1 serine hydrolase [Saprospiraceae bacterium]MCC6843943.1 serine hydrolase [Saprospiraceae bacterium]HRG32361.1 glycoside hydrolase family 3 N-terminal domain-containing protein [Saprospiraceae bacterium]